MSKDKFIKNVGDIKNQASKIGSDAAKTLGKIKDVVQAGLETGKQVINKDALGGGLEKASSGVDIVAKGARLASKGAGALASTMEGASDKLRKASNKLKKPKD